MSPVSQKTVNEAVEEYGLAWKTQDYKRIGRLFTKDAVYVERSFDKRATFRGRKAIEKYWQYQICGKQSNILFRHVDSEMVRDAEKPIAVVKWLAEFDNRREKRADKANKRVKFCQMAKLIFEECPLNKISDVAGEFEMKISYLEEYAQGMVAKSFQWPGIDATADELWDKIRFEPPKLPIPVQCEKCGKFFQSRTKLFVHLRYTDAQYDSDGRCTCLPNELAKEKLRMEHILVCLSVSYSCTDPHERLIQAWNTLQSASQAHATSKLPSEPMITLIWAVPLDLSSSAIVNVVTIKLPQILVKEMQVESLPRLFNEALTTNHIKESTVEHSSSGDGTLHAKENRAMMVHTAGIVDKACAPERREFEAYAAFVPWRLLRSIGNKSQPINDTREAISKDITHGLREVQLKPTSNQPQTFQDGDSNHSNSSIWRRRIEKTSAFKYVDYIVARRLKHGARLMKDGGYGVDLEQNSDSNDEETAASLNRKIKVRTSTMEEPMHQYCKISISMKQTVVGTIQRLVGLLFAYARNELSEGDFIAALQDRNVEVTISSPGLRPYNVNNFPPEFIILTEPAVTRYENKVKIKLCRHGKTNTQISKSMESSLDEAEYILMLRMRREECKLDRWLYEDISEKIIAR